MLKMIRFVWLIPVLILGGCSDNDANDKAQGEKSAGDHVWKTQTNAIEKARGVEQIIQNSADEQRQMIDE